MSKLNHNFVIIILFYLFFCACTPELNKCKDGYKLNKKGVCEKSNKTKTSRSVSSKKINGKWSDWVNSGTCNQQTGKIAQTRTCSNPKPQNGGANCIGLVTQSIDCKINGKWSDWVDSGTCNQQTGKISQTRTCSNPKPQNAGANCIGSQTQSIDCKIIDGGIISNNSTLDLIEKKILDLNSNTYLYAPNIMYDESEGLFKLWACAGVKGDHIIYKEAKTLDSLNLPNWHSALRPKFDNNFDGNHTCDPNVIKVGSTYYLYYGGYNDKHSLQQKTTRIGVASSTDGGRNFSRLNGGNPIVDFVGTQGFIPTSYGIGQPAVVEVQGYFYMIYTHQDGMNNRLRVIKSQRPDFNSYELVKEIDSSFIGAWSVDMAWNELSSRFIVIGNGSTNNMHTRVRLISYDINFENPTVKVIEKATHFQFGEGMALITDSKKRIATTFANAPRGLTFIGSTHGDNRYGFPVHITGPMMSVTFNTHNEAKVVIRHSDNDCPAGYSRLAWLGALRISTDGYTTQSGPHNWALCERNSGSIALKHSSNDCYSADNRIAWIGNLYAGSDGFDFNYGAQDWALCQREAQTITFKNEINGCPNNYTQIAKIDALYAGADGFNFGHGPQNWAFCSK